MTCAQGIRKSTVADVVIKAFVQILCSPSAGKFIAGLKQHVTLACPLVRILMLNEVCVTVDTIRYDTVN